MRDVLENCQAVRDAARAATDLLRAENAGALNRELAELSSVKARADERVATLRRRIQPLQASARIVHQGPYARGATRKTNG